MLVGCGVNNGKMIAVDNLVSHLVFLEFSSWEIFANFSQFFQFLGKRDSQKAQNDCYSHYITTKLVFFLSLFGFNGVV
jgi:hypothetical protein